MVLIRRRNEAFGRGRGAVPPGRQPSRRYLPFRHLAGVPAAADIGRGAGDECMTRARIALPFVLALAFAGAGLALVPRALESGFLLASQDDPVALADHAVARAFDAATAAREIDAALAAGDADLARSFLELARDRNVAVDAERAAKVEAANAAAPTTARSLESFARGFISGEPENLSGLAGTAVGDLFVFGDIRDALREGSR